ncbi:MAG TPA: TPM domain-containing protein [Ignavibacteria bacterium]
MFKNYIKKYLSKEDLKDITDKIKNIELTTSGELRLCLKYKTEWHEKKIRTRDLAIREFHKLGMQNTKEHTGILVMILLKDKKFEIIADKGINSRVEKNTWDNIADELSNHFSAFKFKSGILNLLDKVGSLLAKEFPKKKDDVNELPDDIVIE